MKRIIEGSVVAALLAVLVYAMVPGGGVQTPIMDDLAEMFVPKACAFPTNARDLISNQGGNYYCITNPTIGTPVTYAASTTYAITTGAFQWANAASSTKLVVFDHIKVATSGTATGTQTVQWLAEIDSTARAPTANNATQTPVNIYGPATSTSAAAVKAFSGGAMSLPAASAANRIVARGSWTAGPQVAGDEMIVRFGDDNPVYLNPPLTAARATAAATFIASTNPIVLAPGWNMTFHIWQPGISAAPSYEYEACWYEW